MSPPRAGWKEVTAMRTVRDIAHGPFAPTIVGPLTHFAGLPIWCTITITLTGLGLHACRTLTTQVIRLRVSKQITTPTAAVRALEIEDSPEGKRSRRLWNNP
jgi:hypothetical protein